MSAAPHSQPPSQPEPATTASGATRPYCRVRPPLPLEILRRESFTTGQVGRICQVAPRTVSKWCDTGRLRHWRIPGSEDRRVPRADLIRFLREHGMSEILAILEGAMRHRLLAVALTALDQERLRQVLPGTLELETAGDAFTAGQLLAFPGAPPAAVLFDAGGLGRGVVLALLARLADAGMQPPPRLLVLIPDDGNAGEYIAAGAAWAGRGPLTAALLTEVLAG